jgi:putative endopeptidase
MDTEVRPGHDFYAYANGKWLASAVIPTDRSEIGASQSIYDRSLERSRVLLENARSSGVPMGSLYVSFMDQARVERLGLQPVLPLLAGISHAPDRSALAAHMADLQRIGIDGLVDVDVIAGFSDPSRNELMLQQTSLGMPDTSYYLDENEHKSIRAAYLKMMESLLGLLGESEPRQRANEVFAFEQMLARGQWSTSATRDASRLDNPRTVAQLLEQAPGLDWADYLKTLGAAGHPVVVWQPSAVTAAAAAWRDTPLDVLRDWLRIRALTSIAPLLPAKVEEVVFTFRSGALRGTTQMPQRWREGIRLVQHLMPEAIGAAYTERYFPQEAKARVQGIADAVRAAFRHRLSGNTWMSPATRDAALVKLDGFEIVIGSPDEQRREATVMLSKDDLLGNVLNLRKAAFQNSIAALDKLVDRRSFPYSAAYPLAWATSSLNELAVTAAFLQTPEFDVSADPAINFGAIGVVIGHELSHHFDDQGRKRDSRGVLRDWWSTADVDKYLALSQPLIAQFDRYEPLPGHHVNGQLTLGENLADLGGLQLALNAYHDSLNGHPAPVIDGLTGDQRFFLSYAQSRREKQRDDTIREQILADPHAPERYRVFELRNLDAWYEAFHITPADSLYLPPASRVGVW